MINTRIKIGQTIVLRENIEGCHRITAMDTTNIMRLYKRTVLICHSNLFQTWLSVLPRLRSILFCTHLIFVAAIIREWVWCTTATITSDRAAVVQHIRLNVCRRTMIIARENVSLVTPEKNEAAPIKANAPGSIHSQYSVTGMPPCA